MFRAIYHWILNHDNSWAFIVLYVGLAVVLSIWISLFWLAAVVAAHGVFEWIKQRRVDTRVSGVLARVAWELKLDFGLVLFALVIALYMDFVLGVVGLSAAARAGVQTGARFAGWQRALRGVLLTLDDAAQVGKAVVLRKSDAENEDDGDSPADEVTAEVLDNAGERNVWHTVCDRQLKATASIWGGWVGRYTLGDRISLGFGALCLLLVLAAPWLTLHDFASMLDVLAVELHPYPLDLD